VGAVQGTEVISFGYDSQGIRQSRTINGSTTEFLVDPNQAYAQVLGEYTDGIEQVAYTYGDDLLSQEREGASSYYHYDALGSTRALTDAAGALTDSYAYKAFGEMEAQSGSTPNAYLFAGEQFEPMLSQYYLRDRFMACGQGRFLGLDRFRGKRRHPISLHKYLYGNGNPVSYVDYSGRMSLLEKMVVVGATVYLVGTAISHYWQQVNNTKWVKVDVAEGTVRNAIFEAHADNEEFVQESRRSSSKNPRSDVTDKIKKEAKLGGRDPCDYWRTDYRNELIREFGGWKKVPGSVKQQYKQAGKYLQCDGVYKDRRGGDFR